MSWMLSVAVPETKVDFFSSLLWDLDTSGIAETIPPGPRSASVALLAGFDEKDHADEAAATLADLGVHPVVEPYLAAWTGPESATVSRPGLDFTIEPGHAFGHGGHPTTEMCLDLLLVQLDCRPRQSVLDVGTGTGILAIAAALAGASPVVAIETDEAAQATAKRNIDHNRVEITLAEHIDPGWSQFDQLVANLLLADLRPLAAQLGPAARQMILSGFLIEQASQVLALFPGWSVIEQVESSGWLGLILAPPGGDGKLGARATE